MELASFDLEDGSCVKIEVAEREARGRDMSVADVVDKAKRRFSDVTTELVNICNAITSQFQNAQIEEADFSFSVKVSAKSGVIIAAGGAEANMSVTLRWKRRAREDQDEARIARPNDGPSDEVTAETS